MENIRLLNIIVLSPPQGRKKSIGGDHDKKWPKLGLNPWHSGDSQAPYSQNREDMLKEEEFSCSSCLAAKLRPGCFLGGTYCIGYSWWVYYTDIGPKVTHQYTRGCIKLKAKSMNTRATAAGTGGFCWHVSGPSRAHWKSFLIIRTLQLRWCVSHQSAMCQLKKTDPAKNKSMVFKHACTLSVLAECTSVLHSARPCVLHSAGGPYITFMA